MNLRDAQNAEKPKKLKEEAIQASTTPGTGIQAEAVSAAAVATGGKKKSRKTLFFIFF